MLNGDSVRETIERSRIPGRFTVWGDILYEGPVPRDVSDEEFARVRARYHADDAVSFDDAVAMHHRWNAGLAAYRECDEVVLWFEHDLHDQMLLINLLDWFARRDEPPPTLSLVCIGEFPGIAPFHGLGQLDAGQLESLVDSRQRVTDAQLALAQDAWGAFTADDPTAIERVLAADTSALPFLDGALRRLLEEFPDVRTGLPRTERSILERLAANGSATFETLFRAQQTTEERVFMGDSTFRRRLEDLERGGLVRSDSVADAPLHARLELTVVGRRVLAGDADWMAVGPFDRWIGGTHLTAPRPLWRWSRDEARLVSGA